MKQRKPLKLRADEMAGMFEPATVVLFAGLGGVCIGVEKAYLAGGYKDKYIDLAVNHWDTAVAVHELNHPMTQHLRADVWEVDPNSVLLGRKIAYLHLSPDCTHHSKARGSKPKEKHIRALADVGIVWAGKRRPDVITLENVEEWISWGPLLDDGQPDPARKGEEFQRWVRELRALGYVVDWRVLRACDYGTPTTRKRLFVIARCDGKAIVWPEKTHERSENTTGSMQRASADQNRSADDMRTNPLSRIVGDDACGDGCGNRGRTNGNRSGNKKLGHGGPERPLKPFRTAAECIDWQEPMLSIFATRAEARAWSQRINIGREKHQRVGIPQRPLRPKTQARIAGGLDKWVLKAAEPFIVRIAHGDDSAGGVRWGNATHPMGDPLPTVAASKDFAVVDATTQPFVTTIENYGWDSSAAGSPVTDPLSTVTARPNGGKHALVNVFTATLNHGGDERRSADLRQPLATVTGANDARAVVAAYTTPRYGERAGQPPRSGSVEQPMPAVVGTGNGANLIAVALNKHYGGVVGQSVDKPIGTVTAVDHHSVMAVSLSAYRDQKANEVRGQGVDEPIRTLDTQNRFETVAAHLIKIRGDSVGSAASEPMPTVTSGAGSARDAGAAHALGTCIVYLTPYYGNSTDGASAAHPMPTVTGNDRFAMVSLDATPHWVFPPEVFARVRQVGKWALDQLGKKVTDHLMWADDAQTGDRFPLLFVRVVGEIHLITDIAIRMLRPRELARAQGFDDSYVIDRDSVGRHISKADQVKLIGNSVCPQLAHAIAKANVVDLRVFEDARIAGAA
jgi:DNA (cytosine-5)-methyltransferase 1